jgi:hypothetical protein
MKKQTLRRFTVLSFLLMLTAVTVSAQSERIRVTNIPFSFIVGQKTLPAGEYTLEPNRKDSDYVWLVQSRDGHATALFTTMPVRASETQEEAKLVFHKYGEQYFLSQVWEAGESAGRVLIKSKRERSLERQMEKIAMSRETITLNARH